MSRLIAALASILVLVSPLARASQTNPIAKVLSMIQDLQHTVIAQASSAQAEYNKYVAFCETRSRGVGFEIKNEKADKENLKANIEKHKASIEMLNTKLEDLSADVNSDDSDLKAATELRRREAQEFADHEHDVIEIIDALKRAVSHFSKHGQAALLQTKNTNSVTEALGVMVDALAMSSEDAARLTALVQEHSLDQSTEESDSGSDASDDMAEDAKQPAYVTKASAGVVSVLEDLLERSEAQLSKVRATEAEGIQNYQKLKQALSNQMEIAKQDMHAAKSSLAENIEAKAVAEGDLDVTSKDLDGDIASKEALHHQCMTVAQQFQSTVSAHDKELDALASAKKSIEESSQAATQQTYDAELSFAQLKSHTKNSADTEVVTFRVVHKIRKLAKKTKSVALEQLASRMSSAMRLVTDSNEDPFAKIKGLIRDMLSQLQSDSEADSSHKEYCDKQLAETTAHQDDTSADLRSLSAKTDQQQARSGKLLEHTRTLQTELADLARSQAEAAQLRFEQEALFKQDKAEMEQGLQGIRLALNILREHYGKAVGKEGGIISLLEVIESDFSQGLSGLEVDEEASAHEYSAETKPNFKLEEAAKENDVKLKTKELASINSAVADSKSDISGIKSRLKAINEFDKDLRKTCVSEPDYVERRRRRDQELAGLKDALESLEPTGGDAVLLETSSKHKLRGAAHRRESKPRWD